jgi:hypothetical protein
MRAGSRSDIAIAVAIAGNSTLAAGMLPRPFSRSRGPFASTNLERLPRASVLVGSNRLASIVRRRNQAIRERFLAAVVRVVTGFALHRSASKDSAATLNRRASP